MYGSVSLASQARGTPRIHTTDLSPAKFKGIFHFNKIVDVKVRERGEYVFLVFFCIMVWESGWKSLK